MERFAKDGFPDGDLFIQTDAELCGKLSHGGVPRYNDGEILDSILSALKKSKTTDLLNAQARLLKQMQGK